MFKKHQLESVSHYRPKHVSTSSSVQFNYIQQQSCTAVAIITKPFATLSFHCSNNSQFQLTLSLIQTHYSIQKRCHNLHFHHHHYYYYYVSWFVLSSFLQPLLKISGTGFYGLDEWVSPNRQKHCIKTILCNCIYINCTSAMSPCNYSHSHADGYHILCRICIWWLLNPTTYRNFVGHISCFCNYWYSRTWQKQNSQNSYGAQSQSFNISTQQHVDTLTVAQKCKSTMHYTSHRPKLILDIDILLS